MTDTYVDAMNLEVSLGKPFQKIDDIQNLDTMTEQVANQPSATLTDTDESQSTCTTDVSAYESGQPTEDSPQESIFGGYLTHLSVGVAAAAAIASLFVLKKNT